MSDLLEGVLTVLGNIVGYALAALVVVYAFRRTGDPLGAARALFILWVLTLSFYVGTEYYMDAHWSNPHKIPPWAESTNGIAENIQSEVFQVWLASLVFKYLRWTGSPESK